MLCSWFHEYALHLVSWIRKLDITLSLLCFVLQLCFILLTTSKYSRALREKRHVDRSGISGLRILKRLIIAFIVYGTVLFSYLGVKDPLF